MNTVLEYIVSVVYSSNNVTVHSVGYVAFVIVIQNKAPVGKKQ
jgi:hypothetical protein